MHEIFKQKPNKSEKCIDAFKEPSKKYGINEWIAKYGHQSSFLSTLRPMKVPLLLNCIVLSNSMRDRLIDRHIDRPRQRKFQWTWEDNTYCLQLKFLVPLRLLRHEDAAWRHQWVGLLPKPGSLSFLLPPFFLDLKHTHKTILEHDTWKGSHINLKCPFPYQKCFRVNPRHHIGKEGPSPYKIKYQIYFNRSTVIPLVSTIGFTYPWGRNKMGEKQL